MKSLGVGLLLLAGTVNTALASKSHPEGWKVSVSSSPVSKHGMYNVTVVVKDEARRPVDNAQVRLKLHSIRDDGPRFVTVRSAGKGEYRTWVRLNTPWDNPRRLAVQVTPSDADAK